MPSPLDALHMKQIAYEGMHTPAWARWADSFTDSVNGRSKRSEMAGLAHVAHPDHIVDQTGHGMTARLTRDLDLADAYYISPEMNALVTAAAESWPADEHIHPEDFPTPWGWLWVPGSIARVDIRGQIVHTSAISWHITGGQVLLTYWADKRFDRPDQKATPGWELMPQLSPWHQVRQDLHAPLATTLQMGTVLPPEVSNAIHWMHNPDGSGMTAVIPDKGWTKEQMTPTTRPDDVMAWLISALRIMVTPLAEVRRQGLPAQVRKDLGKRPHRLRNKAVTVIEFRKRLRTAGTGEHVEYSHRFLRRGHWRRQWFGSDTTGDRRQVRIYIHPTIVGPDDKPLILRQHVNAFTR